MVLIFEGADLVGKSTLATAVAEARGWPVVKIRWPPPPDLESVTRAVAGTTIELLRATRPDVILDRSYFSWWAYGPPLGYDVSFMPEVIGEFSQVSPARLVLLTTTDQELRRRYARRPDRYFPVDVVRAANARIPSLARLVPQSLPWLHIDTTDVAVEETIEQVQAFVDSDEEGE